MAEEITPQEMSRRLRAVGPNGMPLYNADDSEHVPMTAEELLFAIFGEQPLEES